MKAAELRQSILQAAVRGKLVPHDPHDEPASELLKQLFVRKMALEKTKDLKRAKNFVELNVSNPPFDIPKSWEWCHLADLGKFSSGKTPDMTNPLFWKNATIPWITSKDMKTKYLSDSALKITALAQENMTTYPKGTLLMVARSGILKRMLPICILTVDSTINQDVKAFSLFDLSMSPYVFYMLKGMEQYILENYTKQVTTVDSLRFSEFTTEMLFPIPPQAEQERIVAKLDELMLLCDALEVEEKKLDALETHFIEYLPKSILQAAVQGKLVPQSPHDEPASELLKHIQREKAQLVKEGKLKKRKPLPPITDSEIPYDLPKGWEWCRLGAIGQIIGGATPDSHNSNYYTDAGQGIPWLTPADMMKYTQDNYIQHGTKDITQDGYDSCSTTLMPIGSIIFSSRAPIGHIAFSGKELCTNQGFKSVVPYSTSLAPWIFYALKSKVDDIESRASGTTFKEVSGKFMEAELIPIPPIAEQQRIVAKVDELLALCNELEAAYANPVILFKPDNIIPYPVAKKTEETLLAARGDVGQLSNEAMQAINDLFSEGEE